MDGSRDFTGGARGVTGSLELREDVVEVWALLQRVVKPRDGQAGRGRCGELKGRQRW